MIDTGLKHPGPTNRKAYAVLQLISLKSRSASRAYGRRKRSKHAYGQRKALGKMQFKLILTEQKKLNKGEKGCGWPLSKRNDRQMQMRRGVAKP